MSGEHRPRIYVAMPFTGCDAENESEVQEISVAVAQVAVDAGYEIHLPWKNVYPLDPPDKPSGLLYRSEREALFDSELVVAIEWNGSCGMGRILELADQNLIPVMYIRRAQAPVSRMGRGSVRPLAELRIASIAELIIPLRKLLTNEDLRRRLEFRRIRWPKRNVPPEYASRIAAIRSGKGMSQAELARRLGVELDEVRAIEDGRIIAGLYVLRVIAMALEVPVSVLHQPGYNRGSKGSEEMVINNFFRRNNLGMGDFYRFVADYENQPRTATVPPTDEELWTLYTEWKRIP